MERQTTTADGTEGPSLPARVEALVPARVGALVAAASRPDAVLAGIPTLFVLAYAFGVVVPFETAAIAVAAVACGLLLVDCLFVHPPSADGTRGDDDR